MRTKSSLLAIGFLVGVAMNAWNVTTNRVHAAPTPPLTSVAHDGTLAGNGTSATPLGIASGGVSTTQLANLGVTAGKLANGAVGTPQLATGAVTAAKLGAPAPSAGQVLGFNGTALSWQAPPAPGGGVRVVDNNGQLVGFPLSDPGVVERLVGSRWRIFAVEPSGFLINSGPQLLYDSPDCSGTGYLPVAGSDAPNRFFADSYAGNVGTQFYFLAKTDGTMKTPQSQGPADGSFCSAGNFGTIAADVPEVVDFSVLGLVPPFRLSQ